MTLGSIDLGGSSVRVATGSAAGVLGKVEQRATGVHALPEEILDYVGRALLADSEDGRSPVAAVGFGFPGLLNPDGLVLTAPNLSAAWRGIDPALEMSHRLGVPVRVHNDARTATLGELAFGAGRKIEACTMVYLGLGTGVGGGIVVSGRLHSGRWGAAGELGHVVVDPNGLVCPCGSRGCVETLAGAAALVGKARTLLAQSRVPRLAELIARDGEIDVRRMADAAARGDQELVLLFEQAGRAVGILIADVVHMLSPDLVVIGGGLSLLGDRLFDPIWTEVRARVKMAPLDGLRIVASGLGDRAGLLGGLVLADQLIRP